jgi:molybdenum cofactor guanylyltransferase
MDAPASQALREGAMADFFPLAARTCGLLLAGGRSTRFGAEKAVARFGDALMMDAVAERFAPLPRFAVSAASGAAAAAHASALGVDVLHDDPSTPSGPLAGVLAGLAWAQRNGFDLLATAPCDAPLLPCTLFTDLLDAIGPAPAAFAVTDLGEHPLCAIWRVTLLPALQERLAAGAHPSVRSFLAAAKARPVRFTDQRAFANANTPDALQALEATQ